MMNVPGAAHTPELEPFRRRLEDAVRQIQPAPARATFYSTVAAAAVGGRDLGADYWGKNLLHTVRFAEAVDRALDDDFQIFVELSPHPLLVTAATQCAAHRNQDAAVMPSMRRGEDDVEAMLRAFSELYVNGWPVDWKTLHPAPRPPVSLPSYPWQTSRCWFAPKAISAPRPTSPAVHSAELSPGRFPLLSHGGELADHPGVYCWHSAFSSDLLTELGEHRLHDKIVFSLAGHVEAALAVALEVFSDRGCRLDDLEISRALVASDDEQRQVQVTAESDGPDTALYRLFSRRDGTGKRDWVRHATCRLLRQLPAASDGSVHTAAFEKELDVIQKRCPDQRDAADHYRMLERLGVQLGPARRGMQRLWQGLHEALAEVHAPGAFHDRLEVGAIDACMQVLSAAVTWDETNSGVDTVYLPVGIKSVEVHDLARGSNRLWSHGVLHNINGPLPSSIQGDVVVRDDAGRLLLAARGVRLERLDLAASAGTNAAATSNDPDQWIYQLTWEKESQRREALPMAAELERPSTWVFFAARPDSAQKVRQSLERRGRHAVEVVLGRTTQLDGALAVDVDRPADFSHVLQKVESTTGRIDGLVFWAETEEPNQVDLQAMQRAEDQFCLGLLGLVKALAGRPVGQIPQLTVVTLGAQKVGWRRDPVALPVASLWGIGRVVQREHPEFRCRLADLGDADGEADAQVLANELLAPDAENQFAIDGETRYLARLERRPPSTAPSAAAIHADGTYLIAGGLGGLGLAVAKWLANRGARRLVLLTRRGSTPETEDAVQDLRDQGVEVHLARGDLADQGRMNELLQEIRESMPPLRGVIHSAAVLDDAMLVRMEGCQLKSVMRPKTLGAWNLHHATLNDPLDFFVVFSSAASMLGPPGGANYAGGNASLDALAQFRRDLGLPGLAIAWGPWCEVGIASHTDYECRIRLPGLGTIDPTTGVDILERLLGSSDTACAAVLSVDWDLVRSAFPTSSEIPILSRVVGHNASAAASAPDAKILEDLLAADSEDRETLLQSYLQQCVGCALGLPPGKIDVRQQLMNIGVDSLIAIELKNKVELELRATIRFIDFLEGPTIEQLSRSLLPQIESQAESNGTAEDTFEIQREKLRPGPLRSRDAAALLEMFDELPDSEIDALLEKLSAESNADDGHAQQN